MTTTIFSQANVAGLINSNELPNSYSYPDTLTENGAPAHTTSGSPCLDFFIHTVRDTSEQDLVSLFRNAFNSNPKIALGLLMHLRDARDGKGERRLTHWALLELRQRSPKLYLLNLLTLVELGYYKDLCHLIELIYQRDLPFLTNEDHPVELDIFAQLLREEKAKMDSNPDKPGLTLAGKWAPSNNTHFDKPESGYQAKTLSQILFPNSSSKQRDYRKLLSSLREQLKVVERLMSEGRWEEIDFGKVPSKAHRLLRNSFSKQQAERYQEYLFDLSAGTEKINVKGTQPHELVSHYLRNREFDQVIESQWDTLLNNLLQKGTLNKTLAIVDVSGSMTGQPMEVAIALGLLTSQCTSPPFTGKCITFSAEPKLHTVNGNTLHERVKNLSRMHWGMNTNLLAVFDLILDQAVNNHLAPERMIETLFIFTDMQFDSAERGSASWSTTHDIIEQKYRASGYKMPQIVYWNLRSAQPAIPCTKDTPGVAMVSGFSSDLLKLFMDGGEFTPETMMMKAVEPYLDLVNLS